jgi:hypothetical protein
MPHHPCGGCVKEEAITGPDVAVKLVLFFVLQDSAET